MQPLEYDHTKRMIELTMITLGSFNCISKFHFRENPIARNDWLGPDPGWLSEKVGRLGLPMRTDESSFRLKLKSSIQDFRRNVVDGNVVIFELDKVLLIQ
jgi:hypothetical protein